MNQIPSSTAYLTIEERKSLMAKSNWKAALQILLHWSWIIGALSVVAWKPSAWTVVPALFILGGKQLACSVLMHDAGHFAVFTNKTVNDLVGQVLGAWPIFQDMYAYRHYHLDHHQTTGLAEDPDILLTRGYPTSRNSMLRKIGRDLIGLTGLKAMAGLYLMHMGYLEYNLGKKIERVSQKNRSWPDFFRQAVRKLAGPLLINGLIFMGLALSGHAWVYLLWIGAYLTTFQFSIRVRSIAEHSLMDDTTNPLKNTRTTYANWVEQLLFAPYHVNYHLEHHMLMTVPSYNLPRMHRLIKARGFYKYGVLESNYWMVLKKTVV